MGDPILWFLLDPMRRILTAASSQDEDSGEVLSLQIYRVNFRRTNVCTVCLVYAQHMVSICPPASQAYSCRVHQVDYIELILQEGILHTHTYELPGNRSRAGRHKKRGTDD